MSRERVGAEVSGMLTGKVRQIVEREWRLAVWGVPRG